MYIYYKGDSCFLYEKDKIKIKVITLNTCVLTEKFKKFIMEDKITVKECHMMQFHSWKRRDQAIATKTASVSMVSSEYKCRLCLCINCALRVHRQTLPSSQLYLHSLPAYQLYLQSTNADSACVSICFKSA